VLVKANPAKTRPRIADPARGLASGFEEEADHRAAVCDLEAGGARLPGDLHELRHEALGAMPLVDLGAGTGDAAQQDRVLHLDRAPEQAEDRAERLDFPRRVLAWRQRQRADAAIELGVDAEHRHLRQRTAEIMERAAAALREEHGAVCGIHQRVRRGLGGDRDRRHPLGRQHDAEGIRDRSNRGHHVGRGRSASPPERHVAADAEDAAPSRAAEGIQGQTRGGVRPAAIGGLDRQRSGAERPELHVRAVERTRQRDESLLDVAVGVVEHALHDFAVMGAHVGRTHTSPRRDAGERRSGRHDARRRRLDRGTDLAQVELCCGYGCRHDARLLSLPARPLRRTGPSIPVWPGPAGPRCRSPRRRHPRRTTRARTSR
jgi:hypothetical protein